MSSGSALHPQPPRALQVEVTGSCNLSCQMCLVAYRPRLGRSASFSLASLRVLLDDLPSVQELTLQGLGEPLLCTHLEELVAEAVARGIRVGFNTNATLLTPQRSEALIAAGLTWLHVSVDGASPATFRSIRHGAELAVVLGNLRGLVEARRRAGTDEPRIQLNTVLMRSNVDELDDLVRLAADVGVDRLWVQGLSHDFTDVADDGAFVEIRRWTDGQQLAPAVLAPALARAQDLARQLGLDLRVPETAEEAAPRQQGEPACDWPWRSAYVGYDGTVQPCCMLMGRDRGRIGNVGVTPLSQLWTSEAYRELRQQLTTDEAPAICSGCSAYRHRF